MNLSVGYRVNIIRATVFAVFALLFLLTLGAESVYAHGNTFSGRQPQNEVEETYQQVCNADGWTRRRGFLWFNTNDKPYFKLPNTFEVGDEVDEIRNLRIRGSVFSCHNTIASGTYAHHVEPSGKEAEKRLWLKKNHEPSNTSYIYRGATNGSRHYWTGDLSGNGSVVGRLDIGDLARDNQSGPDSETIVIGVYRCFASNHPDSGLATYGTSACGTQKIPVTIIREQAPVETEGQITCNPLSTNQIRVRFNYQDATNSVRVRRNGTTIHTHPSGDRSGSIVDNGLTPGTSYTYRLRHSGTTLDTAICETEQPQPADEHKIYGANAPQVAEAYVRDDRQFGVDLETAMWPDAAMRTSRRADNLWLAGVWGIGNGASDNATSDNSRNTNPNYIETFNYAAEDSCPGGGCSENVPLAYVPKSDGLGYPNTSVKDGSVTPAGNNWLAIRDRPDGFNRTGVGSNLSVSSGSPTSCSSYNHRYNPRCGGIASNRGSELYGRTGNWIQLIEISNIHVRGIGLTGSTTNGNIQGGVNANILQQDVRGTRNLPPRSQGPINSSGNPFRAWDNIRAPGSSNSGFSVSVTNPNTAFENQGTGVKNFTYDPEAMMGRYQNLTTRVGGGDVVALLQDGNDRFDPEDYPEKQEPLTYTWGITSADRVDLMWDEYVQWNQIDDKGHWYTNRASGRPTGVARGSGQRDTVRLNRIRETSDGSRERDWYHSQTCTNYLYYDYDEGEWVTEEYECGHWHYTSRSTYCVSGTRINYRYNTKGYYYGSSQTRYGWLNDQKAGRPYLAGTNLRSYFGPNSAQNPSWANTGTNYHWQDTSVTDMSNDGFSGGTGGRNYWEYDRSDRAYSNRYIYNRYTRPSFRRDAYVTGSSCISRYPNGSHYTYSTYRTTSTYYPNARTLYENTTYAPPGYVYGEYGTGAANRYGGDGVADGVVDVSWSWRTNYQRVWYENTYEDHYRKLGPRSANGSPNADNLLYGLDPNNSSLNERRSKVSRAAGEIVSPTIEVGDADIFGANGIDSYFVNSLAQSAFLFSNGQIRNFQGPEGNHYESYYINPDDDRVRANADYSTNYVNEPYDKEYRPDGDDPISSILQDELDKLLDTSQSVNNSDFGSTFDLRQNSEGAYEYSGPALTIGNTNFCGGSGTIIVKGDLIIDGDIGHCNPGSTEREDIPSVGFLVFGDVNIRPNVENVGGAYFATGTIHTGSVLLNDNGNGLRPVGDRTRSDQPLSVRGLMIGHRFILARQLSGEDNRNINTESFEYDGRIVLNPPPGYDYVYRFPSAWNEAAPRE